MKNNIGMDKRILIISLIVFILMSSVYAYTLKDVLSGRISLIDIILGKVPAGTASQSGCTDSDGGLNYYVKGNVISGTDIRKDYCWSPSVGKIYKGPYVIEYFCSVSGEIETDDTAYYCPNICNNGACILNCKPGQIIGDVNGDGKITNEDGNLTLEISVGNVKKPNEICCIDINKDRKINSADAIKILRIAEGLEKSPGLCKKR